MQKTDVSVKNGKLVQHFHFEIEILNRAGEQFTRVVIPYSGLNKISKLNAFLSDKNGNIIRKLRKGEVKERSDISRSAFFEDDYAKEFTMRHNEYPYTLVYCYTLQSEEFFHLIHWVPILNHKTPTLQAQLNIEVPEDYPIAYSQKFTDSFKADTSKTSVRYTWNAKYLTPVTNESFAPPMLSFMPQVKAVPQNFSYEIPGNFSSWQGYGNWLQQLNEGLSDLPESEKMTISRLVENVSDERDRVKILYKYLQSETHYINVSIDKGGLKPYPASYVAKNKYGDCKALTNYFKSVLAYAGTESYYTYVFAGHDIRRIDRSFPSQQFNHVILCVPIKGDTLWLDCTSDLAFDYQSTFIQDRHALIVRKDQSQFVKTPALKAEDVVEVRSAIFKNTAKDVAQASFNNTYKCKNYELLHYINSQLARDSRKAPLRDNFMGADPELLSYNILERAGKPMEMGLLYTANYSKIYKSYANEVLIAIPHIKTSFTLEQPEKRKLPLQLNVPIYKIDTLRFEITKGYDLQHLPENTTISSKFGDYDLSYNRDGNIITVVKSLLIRSGYFPLEKYQDFYEFISKTEEAENQAYIITTRN